MDQIDNKFLLERLPISEKKEKIKKTMPVKKSKTKAPQEEKLQELLKAWNFKGFSEIQKILEFLFLCDFKVHEIISISKVKADLCQYKNLISLSCTDKTIKKLLSIVIRQLEHRDFIKRDHEYMYILVNSQDWRG